MIMLKVLMFDTLLYLVHEVMCLDLILDIFQLHLTLRFVRQRRLTLDFI